MPHVLIVSLGPVQDFIVAARRCRDLWLGSWLLSELTKAAAQAMARRCGLDNLIFPGVESFDTLAEGTRTTVANKIVLRVPDGLDPALLAEEVGRPAMKGRLLEICNKALDRVRELPGGREYFNRRRAQGQVDDLIEYVWVAAPEHGEERYTEARAEAEALLTARRATLLWGRVTWGDTVPKSSLDGQRESVLLEELFDRVKAGQLGAQAVYEHYGVTPTERICGVGLLKRHGQQEGERHAHRFLSTGHVAASPLLERLAALPPERGALAAWQGYVDMLRSLGALLDEAEIPYDRAAAGGIPGPYDGSLLYENRLADLFELVTDAAERRQRVTAARPALARVLACAGVSTPLPYFAILVADGDRMGEVKDARTTPEDQRRLSQALSGFAENARHVVEVKHRGELIYAGGDDVLAFVPLHRALDCARALAQDFKERLAGFTTQNGQKATLSAGLGICHFLDPLSASLDRARQAERLAKSVPEKNALAVIVDKRSGPPTEICGTWGDVDVELADYVSLHVEDLIPDGAAYELRELARLLDGTESASAGDREALVTLARKEAVRILRRKQPAHGAKAKIAQEILGRLEPRLEKQTPGVMADRLIVARLLAQAELQSRLPAAVGTAADPLPASASEETT